jgi:hypothetical protein
MDLNSAAQMVGRALDQPLRGMNSLGRSGVRLSDSQKKLVKSLVETGQTAKAQDVILKELESRYKGAAAAARDTLGGSLQVLKQTWGNLFEMDAGSSLFVKLRESVEHLTEALRSGAVEQLREFIGSLAATSLNALATGLKFVAEHINEIAAVSAALLGIKLSSWIMSAAAALTKMAAGLDAAALGAKVLGLVLSPAGALGLALGGSAFMLAYGYLASTRREAEETAKAVKKVTDQFASADSKTIQTEINGVKDRLKELQIQLLETAKATTAIEIIRRGGTGNRQRSTINGEGGTRYRPISRHGSRSTLSDIAKAATRGESDAIIRERKELERQLTALDELLVTAKAKENVVASAYNIESDSSGKSAVEKMVEGMRNQVKYLNKDGAEFLPILEEMLDKTKLLGKDWRAIKDFQGEIFSGGLAKIQNEMTDKGITGEEYLPGLKELKKQFAELSPEWIALENAIRSIEDKIHDSTLKKFSDRLKSSSVDFDELIALVEEYKKELEKIENPELKAAKISQADSIGKSAYDQKWADASWRFSQRLLDSVKYAGMLREELARLAEKGAEWGEAGKERYAELQSVMSNNVLKQLKSLSRQYDIGKISEAEYEAALEKIIELLGNDLPLAAQIAKDALQQLREQTELTSLSTGRQLAAALKAATKEFEELEGKAILGVVEGLSRAIAYGDDFGEALKRLGQDIIYTVIKMQLMKQITEAFGSGSGGSDFSIGGLFSGLFGGLFGFAKGGALENGVQIKKYASGGVVDTPTFFPMRTGLGLMGETRQPEGIFPLRRMSNGDLGVQAETHGSGPNQPPAVIINVENNSGGEISAKQTNARWDRDANRLIVSAVIENIASNGQIAQILKQRR